MEQLMKIDPTTLRNLRDARAWSQEHLASVAGLSVRTVQRIEADGSASAESRLALAAALDIAPGDLCPTSLPAAEPSTATLSARRARRGWVVHLTLYLLLSTLPVALKLTLTGDLGWAVYPLLGWGLALLLHYRRHRRSRQRQQAPMTVPAG